MCGGTDRFRFDDKGGNGSYICSHCGAGSGVDLVMKFLRVDFRTAKQEIEKHLPGSTVRIAKASGQQEWMRQWIAQMWMKASRLDGSDPASLYLMSRGINPETWPNQLRFLHSAPYKADDGSKSYHPAMVAKYVSVDTKDFTLHITYLDGQGRKANLPVVRKLAPIPMPTGGAIRLSMSAETMGIAEGIETALSATQMFSIPVWAAVNAGSLMKWKPPITARNIIVFADNDGSFTGQMAAYSLAYRLRGEGLNVDVQMPQITDCDWNDVLIREKAA